MRAETYRAAQELAQGQTAVERSAAGPRRKRMFVALVLACLFGPVGLVYAAPRAAAVLGAVGIGAAFIVPFSPTLGLAVLALVWLLSIEWAAAAASSLPVLWYLRPNRSTAGSGDRGPGRRAKRRAPPTTSIAHRGHRPR